MASRTGACTPDEVKIPCTSVQQLHEEIEKLSDTLAPEEKEDTWQKFEKALLRFAGITRGGGYKFGEVYVKAVGPGPLGDKLVACIMSDRGKLSGVATDLLNTMIPRLALNFAPLIIHYLPPIIRIFSRSNKVYTRRSEKCLFTIISHCPVPSMIGMIRPGVSDKAEGTRKATGAALEKIMTEWDRQTIGSKGMLELELGLRKMATERDPEVRKMAKRMWEVYTAKWPERVDDFTAPLTPTIRKYLDISADRKAAARKEPTLAQSTVVKQATARGPVATSVQKILPETKSATAQPVKLGMEPIAPLVARVRVTSIVKPIHPPAMAEPASYTPLEKPDPFASVYPKALLSRSVSGIVAGPSNFATRPNQMRSVSVMPGHEADLAHMASVPQMLEVTGPSRPRIPHSSTMSDLMGPPRHNADGPVRPVRPTITLSGFDMRDPTTPLPRSGGPVRPQREALSSSQYGKAVGETNRKDFAAIAPPRRPVISAADATRSGASSAQSMASSTDEKPVSLVQLGSPPLATSTRFDDSIEAPEANGSIPDPVAIAPAHTVSAVSTQTIVAAELVPQLEEKLKPRGWEPEPMLPQPPMVAGAGVEAEQVPRLEEKLKPREREPEPLLRQPSMLAVADSTPALAMQTVIHNVVDLTPALKIGATIPPREADVAQPVNTIVATVVPDLAGVTVAQLEALLARARERERAGLTTGPAQVAQNLNEVKLVDKTDRKGTRDLKGRPATTSPVKAGTRGQVPPTGTHVKADARRRKAFKPTSVAASSGTSAPKPRSAATALPRKPPVPSAPAASVTTGATQRQPGPPTSLAASTSSSLKSSMSRARLPSATGRMPEQELAAPPLAPRAPTKAALPAPGPRAPTKVGGTVMSKGQGVVTSATTPEVVSPRKARIKLKAALPPPPPRKKLPLKASSDALPASKVKAPIVKDGGEAAIVSKTRVPDIEKARMKRPDATTTAARSIPRGADSQQIQPRTPADIPLPISPTKVSTVARAGPIGDRQLPADCLAISTPLPPSPIESEPPSIASLNLGETREMDERLDQTQGPIHARREGAPRGPLTLQAGFGEENGARKAEFQTLPQPDPQACSSVARLQALFEAREFKPTESPIRPRAISLKAPRTPAFKSNGTTLKAESPGAWSLRSM